jgi:hypothetical protein
LPAIQERRFAMRVKVLLQITADDGTAGDAAEVAVFDKQTERPLEPTGRCSEPAAAELDIPGG